MNVGLIELMIILLVLGVPIALLIALAIVSGRSRRTPQPPTSRVSNLSERSDLLRQRHDRYQEERSRILGMVEQGTISAEEADRLFETLERETVTMACPFCGGEIRAEAAKCKHCRQFLVEEMTRIKRLTKSRNKMLAGVCAGVAEYFDADPALIRVLTAVVIFFSGIFTGLIAYLIAALIIPEEY
jgi:phage shock protein C